MALEALEKERQTDRQTVIQTRNIVSKSKACAGNQADRQSYRQGQSKQK